jgi:hypothetical protein
MLRRDRVEHDHFRAPSVFPALGLLLGAGVVLWVVNVLAKRSLDRSPPRPE